MEIKVIQENTIVIVTMISLSDKILNLFKRTRVNQLLQLDELHIDVNLYSKKNSGGIFINSYSIIFGRDSIGRSSCCSFNSYKEALDFTKKLKNSITLINHGTKEEIIDNLKPRETTIEIYK